MNLARLWRSQGKVQQARELLDRWSRRRSRGARRRNRLSRLGRGRGPHHQTRRIKETSPRFGAVGEFVEVESGKKIDRPELARAIDACRKLKAQRIIAKLDRLSRNILAAGAVHEREAISAPTKAALAAVNALRTPPAKR